MRKWQHDHTDPQPGCRCEERYGSSPPESTEEDAAQMAEFAEFVRTKGKPSVRHASYLSPPDFHRLNWACIPITHAFGHPPYLVGSISQRPDFRDIDLRLILPDDEFAALVPSEAVGLLLNVALSDLIAKTSGLGWPIDFQIQSMTEANGPEHGGKRRNPMGMERMGIG